jgi:hypothetical protein
MKTHVRTVAHGIVCARKIRALYYVLSDQLVRLPLAAMHGMLDLDN